MKKRFLSVVMAAAMTMSLAVSGTTAFAGAEDNSLTIGITGGLTGDFGGEYFGTGVDDWNIYCLTVRGYAVADTDLYGMYNLNDTAVKSFESEDNEDGSRTYTITINDGLLYSNGDAITAADYVARVLYTNMPAFSQIAAYTTTGMYYDGFDAYTNGESETFSGVHLVDDSTFTLTVTPEYIPDYNELRFMTSVFPLPLSVFTDGSVSVEETEEGAKFSKALTGDDIKDYVDAERYTPSVFCGPYIMESYDANAKTVILSINDNFAGNWEGQKPSIEKVIFKDIYTSTSQVDEIKTGNVEMITNISKGTTIDALYDLYDEGLLDYVHYDGADLQGMQIVCDYGATQYVEVRQALVRAMNREEAVTQMTGGYGKVTSGDYTSGMWQYQERADEIDESLDPYSYDLDAAEQLLIDGGWTLNEKGEEFVKGTDTVRYKEVDGELVKCTVSLLGTPTSSAVDLYIAMLSESLPKIGMEFTYDQLEWAVCLEYLYRETDPAYNMIACGNNLSDPAFDQTMTYTTDPVYLAQGLNVNFLLDEELESLAKAIMHTEPGDDETYLDNFVAFQKRWNYLMPMLPVFMYSCHDFFIPELKGWEDSCYSEYDYALVYAYFEEE